MHDVRLRLTNDARFAGWEHLFPERNPRWRHASLPPAGDAGPGDLTLMATPIGLRRGHSAAGPIALWVVLTNPPPDKEGAYNEWYDGRHVADTLAIPAFVTARRYKIDAITGPHHARSSYQALYEIHLAAPADALAEAAARAGGPLMPNPGMLAPGTAALPFRPMA